MDGKGRKQLSSKERAGLDELDKQIDLLRDKYLPHTPHLLFVRTNNPFLPEFPHENKGTPFAPHEVRSLQYMTLIADGHRGIAQARGDWGDEFAGPRPSSANARSNTPTPNPVNKDPKKPAVKYSIKDYQNMKQTGLKPSPRPQVADSEHKAGYARNPSGSRADTPMSRVPSLEGSLTGNKVNGTGTTSISAPPEKGARENRLMHQPSPVISNLTKASRPNGTRAARPEVKESPRANMNGHAEPVREAIQKKDHNTQPYKADQQRVSQSVRHGLPPRSQSPRRDRRVSESKRPLDSAAAPPQKRTKIEPPKPSTSWLQGSAKRPEARSETKPSPVKSSKPPSRSPQAKKPIQSSKPSTNSRPDKPRNLPPLLSPLPADLDNGSAAHSSSSSFANGRRVESRKDSSSNTPSKVKHPGSDVVAAKKPNAVGSSPRSTPPKSSSSPFNLPPILSPSLPDVVEQELLRLQQKSAALNTVEARHEKARQPDAPGVARKTVKSKVGHPPKKAHAETSKPLDHDRPMTSVNPTSIVKLPYKRSSGKIIEQLLRLKAKPSPEFRRLEAQRLGIQLPIAAPRNHLSDSDQESSGPSISKHKPTSSTTTPSKKRPLDASGSRSIEPPAKRREKEKERVETPNASTIQLKPAFKSPAPSGASEKTLLSTPKRPDAMKTVAMRKVDSSDGNARTPQGAAISTPASAERPRINGEVRMSNPEVDRLAAEEKRLTILANKVKHKMDAIIKTKSANRNEPLTEHQKKLGMCVGLEAITVYMTAFQASSRHQFIVKRVSTTQWESIIGLWGFVDSQSKDFPALHSLSARLGAICREELRRVGVKSRDYQAREPKFLESLKNHDEERDKLWTRAHQTRSTLADLGAREILGPWATVQDATNHAMDVLGAYSRKEKLGWKRDPET
ncbi:hypothetical protein BJ875DRAFT_482566 [Amylocarpus encephaloides]|uniref:Uncharacterized protein n=1 Tax=Amylocarpus encephaloides TaxID=45428 RepID=A0A9P8C7C3_9HELO|nr:hypothetical protein BJ875DRAFT_482566 [Amylocarpus encephaloides]